MFDAEKLITTTEDGSEFVKRIIQGHRDEIENLLNDTQRNLGEGMTARVCFLHNEDVCIKIYKRPEDICGVDFYLSPKKEKEFQDKLRFIDHKVRVPKVYACYENSDDRSSFLMMETLNAVSIDDVLKSRTKIPDNFDIDLFEKELISFLELMHKNGIYNRDLHEGNIMIDNETGLPYIIDFGVASRFVGPFEKGEAGPYNQRSNGKNIIFKSDEAMSANTIRKLRIYLTKSN